MPQGSVVSIYISDTHKVLLKSVEQVKAVEGCGIEGDRYFRDVASGVKEIPKSQITLIESEALEALKREYDVELKPEESRRNVLTKGVYLNHLVGREFTVGEATVKGMELCEPCGHLESLTRPGVLKGLIHRGGLRCQIVKTGVIQAGDAVKY